MACARKAWLQQVPFFIEVKISKEQKIHARIVCVWNRGNEKEWIALVCTNPSLPGDEIIRIYGERWNIDESFKTCKSYLNLVGECNSLSYDALTARVAFAFTRYLMIAVENAGEKIHEHLEKYSSFCQTN